MSQDDLIEFMAEDEPSSLADSNAWSVLIVDDDPGVHQSTRFALANYRILGRPLTFESAHSAIEARAILSQRQQPFAVILLDVVMEDDDSGLKLVGFVRDELQHHGSRIILRTGQPGYAPELEVIEKYDINDYKAKSELTRTRLITSLTAAIRSFSQIETINANREGLMMIVEGAAQLFREKAVASFSKGVLIQLCSLLQIDQNGIFCCFENNNKSQIEVLAAFGKFQYLQGQALADCTDQSLLPEVMQALETKQHLFHDRHVVLYLNTPFAQDLLVWVDTARPLSDTDVRLLEIFSVSIAVGFDNAKLFQRIESYAFVDPLTGLSNRLGLLQQLGQYRQQHFSLLFFDLDNFQSVNDGLGYDIGNQCLLGCQQTLIQVFGEQQVLARLSSDNFIVVLPTLDKESLRLQLHQLKAVLSEGLRIGQHQIAVSMTCGIALHPEHGDSFEALLTNASIALKEAKRDARGGFVVFNEQYQEQLQQRLTLANQLANALAQHELSLLYQPQVNMTTDAIIGVEALLRWCHQGRWISPVDFIPIAESSGHIVDIGHWVLAQSLQQLRSWLDQGFTLTMAVNVSLRQLKDPNFLENLDKLLHEHRIPRGLLKLEITESMMMAERLTLIALAYAIRSRGIKVAIDDFGTGYSSLSYIQTLPVDQLKIDRAFVSNIAQHPQKQAITQLIIGMSNTLHLDVIAEGVETQAERDQLVAFGCFHAQGYLYAKPLSADAVQMALDQGGKLSAS